MVGFLKKSCLIIAICFSLLFVGCQSDKASAIQEQQVAKVTTSTAVTTTQKAISTNTVTTPAAVKIVKSDYIIVINLTSNKLTLVKDGKKIAVYPVCTGEIVNGVSRTPSGKYSILLKIPDPAWSGDGYAKPIKGGDPRNPLGHFWLGTSYGKRPGRTLGIHGNISSSSIGKHLSHGCIRMYNTDIPKLYAAVPTGAAVWIGTTKQLTDWGTTSFK